MKKLIIQFQEGKEGAVKRLLSSLKVEVLEEGQIVKSESPVNDEALNALQVKLDAAVAEVSTLKASVQTLEGDKTTLESEKSELAGKLAEALSKKKDKPAKP